MGDAKPSLRFVVVLFSAVALSGSVTPAQTPSAGEIAALHRAVFELQPSQSLPEADKAEALARLYAEGQGVPQDPIMTCTLFDFAARSRMNQPGGFEGLRLQREAEQRMLQYCGRLSPVERQWALRSLACAVFGVPRGTVLDLGTAWWVEYIESDRIKIDFGGKEIEQSLVGGGFLCPSSQVVLFRHRVLDESAPPASQRHFLEMGAWRPGWGEDLGSRVFTWRLFEISGGALDVRAQEQLVQPGSIFPAPATPIVNEAQFRTLDTGEVQYQITLDKVRQGRIEPTRR